MLKWKRFYDAVEAARYASTLARQWRTEDDLLWGAAELMDMMENAQIQGLMDPDNIENYCIVDDEGAVGHTGDAEKHIYWIAYPTRPRATLTCPACGWPAKEGWRFCKLCGHPLEEPADA